MRGNTSDGQSSANQTVGIPRVSESDEFIEEEIYEEQPDDGVSSSHSTLFTSGVSTVLSGAFGAGAGAFSGVNAAISKALAVSPKITSTALSLILACVVAIAGYGVYSANTQLSPALWVSNDECAEDVAEAKTADTQVLSGIEDTEQAKLERAKKIYSVLKTYNPNLSNEHIAAVLSNWDAESGIDETAIETIFDEHYQIGPKKKEAAANIPGFTSSTVFSRYAASGISLDMAGYECEGAYYCGIGLRSDTGPNCKRLLDTAKKMGKDWYDFDWQLAYLIAVLDGFFEPGGFDKQSGNLHVLCDYVCQHVEGMNPGIVINGRTFSDTHSETAAYWLKEMQSWTVDTSYANSVIAMIQNMGGAAATKKVEEEKSKCPKCASSNDDTKVDNSGIAQAAAAMAWPREDLAMNNGTEIYQKVLPAVFNGDTYYKACDRVALSSVRWSGADDDFPNYTVTQIGHMNTSPNWQKVGDSPDESQLQPGDVMINDGHVFIYTGHEVIEKVHGDKAPSSANIVEGHLDTHSAGCGTYSGFGGYMAYRCIKPANSDKYKHVIDGYTFMNSGAGSSNDVDCNHVSNRGEIAAQAALTAKMNNWTDRIRYHGLLYGKEAGDPSMCSEFAIWCLYQAGANFGENLMDEEYSRKVLGTTGSKWSYSWMHVAFYRDNPDKGTVHRRGDGYVPVAGDLIIYVNSKHSDSTSQLWDAPLAGPNHARLCVKSDGVDKFWWVGGNGTSENYIESGSSSISSTEASYFIHLNWNKVHGPINRGI